MNIYRNLTKLLLLGCSIIFISPYTVSAHDLDRTVYPGHMCQFSGIAIPGATKKAMWRRLGNGLFNMDNRNWVYICPILRTHSPTDAIEKIVAVVEDSHASEDPRCRLIASSGRGFNEVGISPYRTAIGSGSTKEVTIQMTDLQASARNFPVLQMECVIPGYTGEPGRFSGILSYRAEPFNCGPLGEGCVSTNPRPIGDVILNRPR